MKKVILSIGILVMLLGCVEYGSEINPRVDYDENGFAVFRWDKKVSGNNMKYYATWNNTTKYSSVDGIFNGSCADLSDRPDLQQLNASTTLDRVFGIFIPGYSGTHLVIDVSYFDSGDDTKDLSFIFVWNATHQCFIIRNGVPSELTAAAD
jgi:hypothetical protein